MYPVRLDLEGLRRERCLRDPRRQELFIDSLTMDHRKACLYQVLPVMYEELRLIHTGIMAMI